MYGRDQRLLFVRDHLEHGGYIARQQRTCGTSIAGLAPTGVLMKVRAVVLILIGIAIRSASHGNSSLRAQASRSMIYRFLKLILIPGLLLNAFAQVVHPPPPDNKFDVILKQGHGFSSAGVNREERIALRRRVFELGRGGAGLYA